MARMTKARRAELMLQRMNDPKDLNYDPLKELIRIAKNKNTKKELKLKIAEGMMPYLYPKQKAIEIDQNQGQAVTFNFDLKSTEDSDLQAHVSEVEYDEAA